MKTLILLMPTRYIIVSVTTWDGYFGCVDCGTAQILMSLLNIGGTRRCYAKYDFVGKESIVIPISHAGYW